MEYEFPIIEHIDDVLPYIEGRDEFVVAEREGYTVINYNVMFSDTFGEGDIVDESAAIRRECRGIMFCSESGEILRRPYQKFFNLNERPETQAHLIDLNKPHHILEKLDGSMIAPFFVEDEVVWGTKMGDTDVAKPVQEFVASRPMYEDMAQTLLFDGLTPIFEWCSRKQRIVLDYPEDQLILVAIRDMETGDYLPYEALKEAALWANVPVVGSIPSDRSIAELSSFIKDMTDGEGFVISFADGHKIKVKSDWYVQIHKAKEAILQDRNIVELILDSQLDDVLAHLPPEDQQKLQRFSDDFIQILYDRSDTILGLLTAYEACGIDRKTFAVERSGLVDTYTKAAIFSCWDDRSLDKVRETVEKTVRKNLHKNISWEELNYIWFGIYYNAR